MTASRAGASRNEEENRYLKIGGNRCGGSRVGKSMAISLFLALPEIRAVDAMPCL